jgi:hypothetical protein
MKNLIEINQKNSKAGRVPVKFVLHKIFSNSNFYNENGISWNRTYTEQNMSSVKGMPLVCQFLDSENKIPYGAHGKINTKDGNVTFEDSLVVGSFDDVYIDDNLEINGEIISGLVGKGYIYSQRFPSLVDYLQEQYDNENPVERSIEICADKSKGNTQIIYDGNWREKGRIPQEYQYSGHALCIGVQPSDNSALMIELNSAIKQKNQGGENMKKYKFELNELAYDDIATLITRAFNKAMESPVDYYNNYFYIYKLYPQSGRVVFYSSYNNPSEYYLTTYTIENNNISIGNIEKVEQDWKPVNNEKEVEINTSLIKDILSKEVNLMDEKILNQFVSDIKTSLIETNSKNAEYETKITGLDEQIKTLNEINSKNADVITSKDSEITKLNERITELETELNSCKKTVRINELNEKISIFTDEQKDYAKDEIAKFTEDPNSIEVNTIVEKIHIENSKKLLEASKANEINSKEIKMEDIFGDISETNSSKNEEVSIF